MSVLSKAPAKILIVEDEAILAKSLETTLTGMGYEVVGIADTGVKAIFQFFSKNPDLILMDIRLKGDMDGIQAAEKIRTQRAIPVVFLTGNQDPKTFERAKIEGAFGYVLKPFQERELQINIEIALAQFDASQRKAELESSLLNAEKLGAAGTLANKILQDVSAPLMLLRNAIGHLRDGASTSAGLRDDPLTDTLPMLERQASTIESVVGNYRRLLQNTDVEKPRSVELLGACRQAFEMCRYSALRQGVLFKEIQGNRNATAYFAPTSLTQVLVNLIRNGCDAVQGRSDAWVQVSWEDAGDDFLNLRVTDSGAGIALAAHEKVFQALYTTKPPGQGSGLGLSLCRRIMETHGGAIHLDLDGPNTCFMVTLPKRAAVRVRA